MASTPPPKMNKKEMATAAGVAFPEVGMAMAAKDAMDSKKTKDTPEDKPKSPKPERIYSTLDEIITQQRRIFWFAIFIHLVDGFLFGFARTGMALTTILTGYGLLGIYVARMYNGDFSHKKGIYIGILLALLLPLILDFITRFEAIQTITFFLAFSGLLLAIPMVPIFAGMSFKENEGITKWTSRYFFIWMVIGMIVVLATYGASTNSVSKSIVKPWDSIKYLFSSIGKSIKTVEKNIAGSFKKAISQATGQPYDGQEESRVGIYVEDVKPIESKYNTNANVYVEARIKAVNVKEKVNVNTVCYIEGERQGDVYPTMLYDVSGDYDNIVSCNLGKLKEGFYEVKVRANFEFESTSDIEYTFVNSKLNSDQYDKLNINRVTVATYTGGPVELGLPSLTQPLRIEVTESNTQLSSYPFGVSLKNNWPQGKVVKGIRYLLNTPTEVTLKDCSRDAVLKLEPDTNLGRNTYTFEMSGANARDVFDAITCRMEFKDVNALLGQDLKNVKTFVARAKYEYAVESSTMIVVEKN
jgi:hypothetical protein